MVPAFLIPAPTMLTTSFLSRVAGLAPINERNLTSWGLEHTFPAVRHKTWPTRRALGMALFWPASPEVELVVESHLTSFSQLASNGTPLHPALVIPVPLQ